MLAPPIPRPLLPLGPFQDAVIFDAQRAMAAAIELAFDRIGAAYGIPPDEIREWLAIDAAMRAGQGNRP